MLSLHKTSIILSSIFIICGLILPNLLYLAAETNSGNVQLPENIEEIKQLGKEVGQKTQAELPGILEKTWKEDIKPLWQKIWGTLWNWFNGLWQNVIRPKVKDIFLKEVEPRIQEEIGKRKPQIEKEIETGKQVIKEEAKQETLKIGQSLWERFQALLK